MAVIFVIISFFIFRHGIKIGVSTVEVVSSSLLYPLLRIQHAIIVPIAEWFKHKATMYELQDQLMQLQKLSEELYAENIRLKSLYSYDSETKELQNFNKRYALHHGCMVQVLVRHFSPTKQFFLVNAGLSHGIKKDMVALYGNNIIGKVAEVYPWYCKVCLITDADCKVAAVCQSKPMVGRELKKGAQGIHEGINDVLCTTLHYVSHLEMIEIDDMVYSSGEGLVFPKGFALGKVIEAQKEELFYTITVKPLLDLQTLHYCTLIAKEDVEK